MSDQPLASIKIPIIQGHTDVFFYDDYLMFGKNSIHYTAIRDYSMVWNSLRINFCPIATSFELHIRTDIDMYYFYWHALPFNIGGRIRLVAFQQLWAVLEKYVLPKVIDHLLDLHKRGKPLEFKRVVLEPEGIRFKRWGQNPDTLILYRNIISFEDYEDYGAELRIRAHTDAGGTDTFVVSSIKESFVLPTLLRAISHINT